VLSKVESFDFRNPDEFNKLYLSWQMFCKEPLPDRNFTFWEWFYRIFILTNNQVLK
jgi:signal transducer and activator of transcription 5B